MLSKLITNVFQFLFTDITNNLLFVTSDLGKTFIRRELNFTPSEVSFHEMNPSTFVILDKNEINNKVSVSL